MDAVISNPIYMVLHKTLIHLIAYIFGIENNLKGTHHNCINASNFRHHFKVSDSSNGYEQTKLHYRSALSIPLQDTQCNACLN